MDDQNPFNDFLDRMTNGTTIESDDQNGDESTQDAFPDLEHVAPHSRNEEGEEVEERRVNANRLAQAQAQRNRASLERHANSSSSSSGTANHGRGAPFQPQDAHTHALRNASSVGNSLNLAPGFFGTAGGQSIQNQQNHMPTLQSAQVAPVARMLPLAQLEQTTADHIHIPRAEFANARDYVSEIPRYIVDRIFLETVGDPGQLDDFVLAWQTAIRQHDLESNIPGHLDQYIPSQHIAPSPPQYVPLQIVFPDRIQIPILDTRERVNDYLIEVSTRYPGFFGSSVFETGIQGGWASYMPRTNEVAVWRSILMNGMTQRDQERGRIWVTTALKYIASTASHRLEIYGVTNDPNVGLHDTREAFEYLLDRIFQERSHDQCIARRVQRVQELLRNVPLMPLAGPAMGLQLMNEHIREVRSSNSILAPRASSSSGAELRPRRRLEPISWAARDGHFSSAVASDPGSFLGGIPSTSAAPAYEISGPTADRSPSSFFGQSFTATAEDQIQLFSSAPIVPMLAHGLSGSYGTPGSALGQDPSESFGGLHTGSSASDLAASGGLSPFIGGSLMLRPPGLTGVSSASTMSAIATGTATDGSAGTAKPLERRRIGRPPGSKTKNRTGVGRGSTTESNTTTSSTPAGPASRGRGKMPEDVNNNQFGAPSLTGPQLMSTGEASDIAGTRPRRRQSNMNYNISTTEQLQDDDDDVGRCDQCRWIGAHAPRCPVALERCGDCGSVIPNHSKDCPER
ncbi:hypothetical protein FKW77_007822 [Venturia effusa]|uniref:Uncharacterized protein n=1 Tax=Venturia effusa TaxID=50376 RepID=A0A517LHM0_9PEZI|nr:hypothetical protein FKW77_007822 [Venturia effusa]